MNKLGQILKGLTGVTEAKQPETYQQQILKQLVLLTGLHEPPSYFVYFLMKVAGFTEFNDWDKSRWQFYVQYKNIHFCVRDVKMSTWSIDALELSIDKDSAKKVAEELRGRIVKTSRNLDKLLKPMLQDFIDRGNYALPNPYRHLRNLYDYFRGQVEETLDNINHLEAKDNLPEKYASMEDFLGDRVSLYNQEREYERIATYNACAMVSFFFSYVEFFMDILFIFYPVQNLNLHDFQELSWRERFKSVFPVAKDTNIAEIYRKLLEIRDGWRNVIEHGFRSKEEPMLVPLPGMGLTPISYVSASKAIHFAITPSPENGVQEALDVFSSFDRWVTSNQQALYVILYAQSDFPIPLAEQRLQEIRGWMTSPDTFKQALDAENKELQCWLDQYQ